MMNMEIDNLASCIIDLSYSALNEESRFIQVSRNCGNIQKSEE